MTHWTVRRVRHEDVDAAVALIRSTFDADLLPYMTYGQTGVGGFLRASLPSEGIDPQREGWVAVEGDRVRGFAEFTFPGEGTAHLAYLCVDPLARGRGVATSLVSRAVRTRADVATLTLDVFATNDPARSLYTGWGLDEVSRSSWTTRPMPAASGRVRVTDLARGVAMHAAFGFSMITVQHDDESVVIGRLGEHCLRMPGPAEFCDDDLLSTLRAGFPHATEALLIGAAPAESPVGARLIATSIRMAGAVSTLRIDDAIDIGRRR